MNDQPHDPYEFDFLTGCPTAIIGSVPPAAHKAMPQLTIAIQHARDFRTTGRFKSASFGEGERDDDL